MQPPAPQPGQGVLPAPIDPSITPEKVSATKTPVWCRLCKNCMTCGDNFLSHISGRKHASMVQLARLPITPGSDEDLLAHFSPYDPAASQQQAQQQLQPVALPPLPTTRPGTPPPSYALPELPLTPDQLTFVSEHYDTLAEHRYFLVEWHRTSHTGYLPFPIYD
ncbi:hypothetical protein PAPYR_8711 [Paratrimastix pyriformis]|uniref:C2H2-type domain-containing protein n=1 Tax=Paratrimastix pyriformis TaxID=342808 RepID=A0ABQ8UA46_9EUKA|nr:hypothetical protein PAPYR_8711 [Paratrimastix pyriformis]